MLKTMNFFEFSLSKIQKQKQNYPGKIFDRKFREVFRGFFRKKCEKEFEKKIQKEPIFAAIKTPQNFQKFCKIYKKNSEFF